MKRSFRTPFFEIGIKNYIFGDDVLQLAQMADEAAIRYDVDVMMITPYTEIRRVADHTERLIVLAPYMDLAEPGRGIANILPEALQAAGAAGVVINHSEKPMTIQAIAGTIEKARELGMLSFVCADTVAEAKAIALFHPDIINPEPTELIGSGAQSDMGYVKETIKAIKSIDPSIVVEQAAGITTPEQVYDLIIAGADAVGSASGIFKNRDPVAVAQEMIRSVRRAIDDLAKLERRGAS